MSFVTFHFCASTERVPLSCAHLTFILVFLLTKVRQHHIHQICSRYRVFGIYLRLVRVNIYKPLYRIVCLPSLCFRTNILQMFETISDELDPLACYKSSYPSYAAPFLCKLFEIVCSPLDVIRQLAI